MRTSTKQPEIGIVVDAGPNLGYGHVLRCIRLARALGDEQQVVFHPLSDVCKEFVETAGFRTAPTSQFPPLVITDLREPHGITAAIRRNESRHISIHDLGLAQCRSDVAIDGSVARLFPYAPDKDRTLYAGPQYMITRNPVARQKPDDTVLVTFGGGSTAAAAAKISEELWSVGLRPITTRGFVGSAPMSDADFGDAMSKCRFAISASGVTLYDLMASGVPTIAVAVDRIQLRTADAFCERGAVLNAGILDRLSPNALMKCCLELLESRSLAPRLSETGRMLVDGKGLSRVVEIVRRQLWLTNPEKTFTAC